MCHRFKYQLLRARNQTVLNYCDGVINRKLSITSQCCELCLSSVKETELMFLIRINFFLLFLNQDTSCIFYNMRSVAKSRIYEYWYHSQTLTNVYVTTLEFSRCENAMWTKGQNFHNLMVFRFVTYSRVRNQLNFYSKGRGYNQFDMAISVLSSYFLSNFIVWGSLRLWTFVISRLKP